MATFSQRYGYEPVSNVLIRERIPEEIQNSICNAISKLNFEIRVIDPGSSQLLGRTVWEFFLNQRSSDYSLYGVNCVEEYILDSCKLWYKKLDLLEFIIQTVLTAKKGKFAYMANKMVEFINNEFSRHNFAYRIVDNVVVEITSKEEIDGIQAALDQSQDNVREHLQHALQLLSNRENPDFRNSIKESISAVEAICREHTGEETLGKALKKLEDSGVQISNMLKLSFEKLYAYTNQPDTGIRHALMDEQNAPTYAEALFMLVSCSAFVNYLRNKIK